MTTLVMRAKYFMWGLSLYLLVSIWMYGLVWGPFAAICGIASYQACVVLSLSICAVLAGGILTVAKHLFSMNKYAILPTTVVVVFMFVGVNHYSIFLAPFLFIAILYSKFCGFMIFMSLKERYLRKCLLS